ncbi:hypothetical protein MKY04_09175 [Lysinibacillus telephonicus]|uniref:hypothetical protein n=1 Tax=Lysinibacillus telephonicus TaxID=1714840 RepID=UPI0031FCB9E2
MDIVICEPVIHLMDRIARVGFRRLEIRVDGRDYMLSSYESTSFDLETDTFAIIDGDKKFSFIHGKEIIVTVEKLCSYGNNAQILIGKIEKALIEENRKCWIDPKTMNDVMGGIFKLHEAHAVQARENLIDRALETGDKELFERMVRMEVPECK